MSILILLLKIKLLPAISVTVKGETGCVTIEILKEMTVKKNRFSPFLFLVYTLFSCCGQSVYAEERDPVCVPILMYHEIKTYKTGKDVITPYEFERDLQFLKENEYTTITMTDLIGHVYENRGLPPKPIILTFDDGYLNNFIYAFPLLQKYGAKIVLSIIGKNTDDFTRIPDKNPDYSHVTWEQLNDMIQSGLVEAQNHSYNLHSYSKKRIGCIKNSWETESIYRQILTEDIEKLQAEMKEMTGCTPNTFTYPYGHMSKEGIPILKQIGFKASLSCTYGVNLITRDPESLYGLKRICRAHGTNLKKLLAEAMKTIE